MKALMPDEEEDFDLLGLAGIGWDRRVNDLPSWIPDWSCLPETCFGPVIRDYVTAFKYCASGKTARYIRFEDKDQRIISLRGLKFDEVALTSGPASDTSDAITGWIEWLCKTYAMVAGFYGDSGLNEYPNGQSLHDAYFEYCVIADDYREYHPVMSQTDEISTEWFYPNSAWESLRRSWLKAVKARLPSSTGQQFESFLREALEAVPGDHHQRSKQEESRRRGVLRGMGNPYPWLPSAPEPPKMAGVAKPGNFAVTKSGYMALLPDGATAGDVICIIYGARTPYVLRWVKCVGPDLRYQLVGNCYVHGIVEGEALDMGFPEMEFTLE
jgi:hypothetical protein